MWANNQRVRSCSRGGFIRSACLSRFGSLPLDSGQLRFLRLDWSFIGSIMTDLSSLPSVVVDALNHLARNNEDSGHLLVCEFTQWL